LSGVKTGIVGEVWGIGVPSAEEVEEENAAVFGYEGMGDGAEGEAWGGNSMDEEDLASVFWAPFVDSCGSILYSYISI
jgi:hypothetical protein